VSRPKIGVLYAPGINCHEETAFAVDYAGGQGEVVALYDVLAGQRRLDVYAGLIVPGGFSYGDHLAAGRVYAIHLIARLADALRASHAISGASTTPARSRPTSWTCCLAWRGTWTNRLPTRRPSRRITCRRSPANA
jgi:hypothetical protein